MARAGRRRPSAPWCGALPGSSRPISPSRPRRRASTGFWTSRISGSTSWATRFSPTPYSRTAGLRKRSRLATARRRWLGARTTGAWSWASRTPPCGHMSTPASGTGPSTAWKTPLASPRTSRTSWRRRWPRTTWPSSAYKGVSTDSWLSIAVRPAPSSKRLNIRGARRRVSWWRRSARATRTSSPRRWESVRRRRTCTDRQGTCAASTMHAGCSPSCILQGRMSTPHRRRRSAGWSS
mmetsp:Transcript_101350/g.293101  ORF Transcript_101350/g.293101 Transcript_101350/m.293101 type:complete len:237 (+) Transcript_101350:852-1562(+)